MIRPQMRVLSVQDLSCFGKCSSTVALPVLSACGHEGVILPTAVFSTHTGGFHGYHIRDLTEDIRPVFDHWQAEGIRFDAAMVGYLCEGGQCATVAGLLDTLRGQGTRLFVDPAMADGGKLYPGFTDAHVAEMAALCRAADVILPNMTEACLMLGVPQRSSEEKDAREVLSLLRQAGYPAAVLTGVLCDGGKKIGAVGYDAAGVFHAAFTERADGSFHGTGDLFAAAYVGEFLHASDMDAALRVAVDFTADAIRRTVPYREVYPYGVMFEPSLPLLYHK